MRFYRSYPRQVFLTFCTFLILFTIIPAFGQNPPAPQLGVMQTAETLGKGGSTTTFGLFQFEKERLSPEQSQRVLIGNFEESHKVELEIETFLIPIRFTYGVGDRLDLVLGATFSTGGISKTIPDFYDTGNPTLHRRAYEQSLFDIVVGLKHNLKPDLRDGLPSISVGGEVQLGFTADNKLNSDNEFIDHSPADSFPFFGINTYMVGTQRLWDIMRLHGGVGLYLSSKSLKTTDSFTPIWQVGGEIAFSDNLWVVADFTREFPLGGVSISNLIGLGFRYEVSETGAFHVGYVSEPGFRFYFTIGGEGEGGIAPQPETGDELLF